MNQISLGICIRYILLYAIPLLLNVKTRAQFVEVGKNMGIDHVCGDPTLLSGGVAFFDFNNDGFEDIYAIGGYLPDKIYENQGDGTFKDATVNLGIDKIKYVRTMGVASGDLDNDGYSDLLITTQNKARCYLFWNRQGSYFDEGALEAGITESFYGSSIAFGDFDIDGNLDIYIGNYDPGPPGDYLFRNQGNRTFSDVSRILEGNNEGMALVVAFSDFDFDNDLDILLGNDFGFVYQPNRLFVNELHNKTFIETSNQRSWDLKIGSMGIAIGDYDEDGDLDYYISDMDDNHLLMNQADHTFREMASQTGVDNPDATSWGSIFLDYNNDSYLDLMVVNGVFEIGPETQFDRLFKGNGFFFEDVSDLQGVAGPFRGRGLATADYNNDGHLDILVGVVDNGQSDSIRSQLYLNPGFDANWAKFKLRGTQSNRDAIGSLVRIYFEGRSLVRELSGGGSYLSQSSHTIYFGIGTSNLLDSVVVNWPNSTQVVYTNIDANQQYEIIEGGGIYLSESVAKTMNKREGAFLQGKLRYDEGVYVDTIYAQGRISTILKTKLLIKSPEPTVTGIAANIEYHIWPNPFIHQINISAGNRIRTDYPAELTIFDFMGRALHRESRFFKNRETIDLEHLKLGRGMYIIQINDGKLYKQSILKK